MSARRFTRISALMTAFGLGSVVVASDPSREKEEAFIRLSLAQLQVQTIPQTVPLTPRPKGTRPQESAPLSGGLPSCAIARLGDTRLRHAAPATCLAFSPDSRRIITGGRDETLRIWDVQTGDSVQTLSVEYTPAAIRFTHSGTRLAVSAGNGSPVRFLHPGSLKKESTFEGGSADGFAMTDDGKLIASITADNQFSVSEVETGLPMLEIPQDASTGYRFAFLPHGKSIAFADRAGKVTIYKVAGGKPLLSFEHGGPMDGLAVSGDGKRLATGGAGSGGTLKIWNLDVPGGVKNVKPAVAIKGVSQPQAWFGADRIAAANREGAGIYDLARNDWVGFARGAGDLWAVSPDEKFIASAGAAALRVRVWDLTSGKQIHSENDAFPDVAFLAPTPDGKSLFVLAGDAAYRWPMGQREAVAAGQLPSKAIVAASGGGRLAVATPGEVLIYDGFDPAKGLGPKPSRTLKELAAGPRAVAVSHDGRRVAYSGEAARIIVADAATGKTIRVLPGESIGLGLEFTPDGSKLAVVGRDAFLRLWPIDAAGGEDSDVWRVRLQRAPRAAVAFSADGAMVAATSATMIKVVNTATGELVAQLDRRDIDDGVFQHVAFTPDSRLIVTGSAGLSGAVHVYELETRTLIRRFTTSLGSIHRLSVLPGGSRAVSAGAEEVITLWDLTGRRGRSVPSSDDLAAAWADLDALDGAKGDPALQTLVAGGVDGVRTVAAGIDSAMANQRSIAGLVKDLASEELAVREAATRGLLAGGYSALLAVKDAAARAMPEEVRARAGEIVKQLMAKGFTIPAHGIAGDNLRFLRAVHALEAICGADARAQIERIASITGKDDRANAIARAALKRMRK